MKALELLLDLRDLVDTQPLTATLQREEWGKGFESSPSPSESAWAPKQRAPCQNVHPACEAQFTPQDEESFEHLFLEHWNWAVSFAGQYQGIDDELVAIQAMHKALVRFDKTIGNFRTLLRHILRCEMASAYRSNANRLMREESLREGFDLQDETICHERERRELAELLDAALSQLPSADRRLLELHFYDDYTYEEIVHLC